MPYLPDIACFQAPGIPRKTPEISFSQLYQPCDQFPCISTEADPGFRKRGPKSEGEARIERA